jgi:hypothetical protein
VPETIRLENKSLLDQWEWGMPGAAALNFPDRLLQSETRV